MTVEELEYPIGLRWSRVHPCRLCHPDTVHGTGQPIPEEGVIRCAGCTPHAPNTSDTPKEGVYAK